MILHLRGLVTELLSWQRSQLNPFTSTTRSTKRAQVHKRDWAHVVDINKPMKNFHELVPEMAHKVRLLAADLSGNALADRFG